MSAPRRITVGEYAHAFGQRLDGSPLVLLLDVDGTLAPIAPRPGDARVPDETRAILRALARTPGVIVAFVSGRSVVDATRVAGLDDVWAVGNHGFEIRAPGGEVVPDPAVAPYERLVADAARELMELELRFPGVVIEDKRWTLSVHYRNAVGVDVAELTERCRVVAGRHGLRTADGKMVVELRPAIAIDKGTASVALVERVGGAEAGGSVAYIGDDRTDEDAFRALRARVPDAVTVRVLPSEGDALQNSAAEFVVDSTDDVRALLEWIAARRR